MVFKGETETYNVYQERIETCDDDYLGNKRRHLIMLILESTDYRIIICTVKKKHTTSANTYLPRRISVYTKIRTSYSICNISRKRTKTSPRAGPI
jgi:hypothetical protein